MTGDIFHILNRGVEKGLIFRSHGDYHRFVCALHRFNNVNGALRLNNEKPERYFDNPPKQEKLVNILKWCLMPNHYHILVEEAVDGGAVEFAKRIGNGYTKYFNTKNKRSGYLFQNAAKIIPMREHEHFLYTPFYIDSNPLKLLDPGRGKDVPKQIKPDQALNFLKSYKWSSFCDYFGADNFPQLLDKESFFRIYETDSGKHQDDFTDWVVDNSCQPATSTWQVDRSYPQDEASASGI